MGDLWQNGFYGDYMQKHCQCILSREGEQCWKKFVRVHEFQKICGNKAREQKRLKNKKVGLIKQIPVGDRD